MRYEIASPGELVITFGSGSAEFEFSLDKGALRTLVQLGSEAMAKLDNYPAVSDHSAPGDQTFHDDKQGARTG